MVPNAEAAVDQIRIIEFWEQLLLVPWNQDLRKEVSSSDSVEATTGGSETSERSRDREAQTVGRMTEVRAN